MLGIKDTLHTIGCCSLIVFGIGGLIFSIVWLGATAVKVAFGL